MIGKWDPRITFRFNILKFRDIKHELHRNSTRTHFSVVSRFHRFVAIVSDESPRSRDNAALRSIYLGTSELFIYKCLTSRRRLGSLFFLPSRLLFLSLVVA